MKIRFSSCRVACRTEGLKFDSRFWPWLRQQQPPQHRPRRSHRLLGKASRAHLLCRADSLFARGQDGRGCRLKRSLAGIPLNWLREARTSDGSVNVSRHPQVSWVMQSPPHWRPGGLTFSGSVCDCVRGMRLPGSLLDPTSHIAREHCGSASAGHWHSCAAAASQRTQTSVEG